MSFCSCAPTVAEILIAGGVRMVEACCGPEDFGLGDLVRVACPVASSLGDGAELMIRSASSAHRRDPVIAGGRLVVVGWSTRRSRAPHGTRALHVSVPRGMLAITDDVLDRVIGRHDAGGLAVFEALVRPMMTGVLGRLGELSKTPVNELGSVWPALITMLLRALDGQRAGAPDLGTERRIAAMRYIEAHLPDPTLNPDGIATALHMSRRTLYKVLSADGAGVAAIIRRERLRRARRILSDPAQSHRTIGQIGTAVGLPCAARFSRLFRAEFGETPRDLRARERFARRAV